MTLRSYKRLLIFSGAIFALISAGEIQKRWRLQETVWTQKATLQGRLPIRVNDGMTVVDVHAGLWSLTRVFRLLVTPQNIGSFEKSVHRSVCAIHAKNISDGISYTNEYRTASGDVVARVEVSSCP
jgi:hypothetical protein